MKLRSGFTPRQYVMFTLIEYLRRMYRFKTEHIKMGSTSHKETREIRSAVARLHNQMLDRSGLDGRNLPE